MKLDMFLSLLRSSPSFPIRQTMSIADSIILKIHQIDNEERRRGKNEGMTTSRSGSFYNIMPREGS
jgi:hypothetical protein